MKVKLLNAAGYYGLDGVLGKTLNVVEVSTCLVYITAKELLANGADTCFVDEDELDFPIPKSMVEVV
jgi:hypothetical protein